MPAFALTLITFHTLIPYLSNDWRVIYLWRWLWTMERRGWWRLWHIALLERVGGVSAWARGWVRGCMGGEGCTCCGCVYEGVGGRFKKRSEKIEMEIKEWVCLRPAGIPPLSIQSSRALKASSNSCEFTSAWPRTLVTHWVRWDVRWGVRSGEVRWEVRRWGWSEVGTDHCRLYESFFEALGRLTVFVHAARLCGARI